eukprot:gnl/MRDRNA2_/MRDRNA2_210619_c0_seq1.p1 gnl/MRDRNA2_/MRDRNA2_210619_c0~~gnl/MRDRNA2_/MRDRNA2_210619_c0_seq1.p1  ORF type:complete len:113 (+),score=31.91 gnl/MRDRNA2_/MRDRNA2_210619_c0_seq1:40-339(+)
MAQAEIEEEEDLDKLLQCWWDEPSETAEDGKVDCETQVEQESVSKKERFAPYRYSPVMTFFCQSRPPAAAVRGEIALPIEFAHLRRNLSNSFAPEFFTT